MFRLMRTSSIGSFWRTVGIAGAVLLLAAGCKVRIEKPRGQKPAQEPPAEEAQIPVVPEKQEEVIQPVQPLEMLPPEVPTPATPARREELTDDQLLEKVQRQTFRYFWDFAHPISGMARERSRPGVKAAEILPFAAEDLFPPNAKPGEHGLRAEYFANKELKGPPSLIRIDPQVNMDWGTGSPGGSLPIDGFSARWTGRFVSPESGDFELALGSDDGARLYLDNQLVIDSWGDHGYAVEKKTMHLEAGRSYDIRLEYYEGTGTAMARLGQIHPEGNTIRVISGDDVCAVGGTGFGAMAIIVAAERGWITREQAGERLLKLVAFLRKADRFHGIFPHWLNGTTGKVIPFTPNDNGGDLVETSYLMEGLLCARQYFNRGSLLEVQIRTHIGALWDDADWNWYTKGGENVLYWHWSPKVGWAMNMPIHGWNECLITYVLAASSVRHSINPNVYHEGWARNGGIRNGKAFYGITLPLGWDYGGPMFFAHYSFTGLDPRHLKDRYADYWQQNVNHTLINRAHCVQNPYGFAGYGENCWGLTASDNHEGYGAQSPTDDRGVISPTAALSSFPYTPEYSMQALKHFYYDLGDKIWSDYGFVDAFSEQNNWYAKTYLAIDQGPIIAMIENYRSGLLWKLFMSAPEVRNGLRKLGFENVPAR